MVLKSSVILAVGAHPDDIELGCGGTIRAASVSGKKVIAVFLTKGEKSGDPQLREAESKRALGILGVNEVFFGDFPDTEIPSSHKGVEFLERIYDSFKPDAVLTHTLHDTHQDHRQVSCLSLSAFRNAPRLLGYETPRATGSFSPNYFVDISGYVSCKWDALKCHLSQSDKRYLAYESMVNLASFRGNQAGLVSAEAFEVIRYVEKAP
jgi:LmbE family N-acetylglucosaminyl deacetylase